MIKYEWKKLWFKQKGLFILLFLVLLKIILTSFSNYQSSYVIDRNEEMYLAYIELLEGKITEETTAFMQEEIEAVTRSDVHLANLTTRWQNDEISLEHFEREAKIYLENHTKKEIFQVVRSLYDYANSAPDQRYILDGRGWETLLTNEIVDILLILCLIAIITPLFCQEYESEMDVLLLSSKKGKNHTGLLKLVLGCIIAISVTLGFNLIDYVYISQTVGLRNGNFPLQSLAFFHNSPYQISLLTAYLIVIGFRLLGAVMLACLICFISILSKKGIVALILTTALTVVPSIIFSTGSTLYYLPIPAGLFQGVGYLRGTFERQAYSEIGELTTQVIFQEIPFAHLLWLLGLFIVVIILLFWGSLKTYVTGLPPFKIRRKKTILSIGVVTSLLVISGCVPFNQADQFETLIYSQHEMQYGGITDRYQVELTSLDFEMTILLTDLKTNETQSLIKDPIKNDNMKINAIFVHGDYCYYLLAPQGIEEGVTIYQVDLKNFNQTLIYNSVLENRTTFFGLLENQLSIDEMERIPWIMTFFLNNDYIYLITYEGMVIQVDRKTNEEQVVIRNLGKTDILYMDGFIYYADIQGRLMAFDESTQDIVHINNIYAEFITIQNGRLAYRDLFSASDTLIYIDLE